MRSGWEANSSPFLSLKVQALCPHEILVAVPQDLVEYNYPEIPS